MSCPQGNVVHSLLLEPFLSVVVDTIEHMFEDVFERIWPPGPELVAQLAALDLDALNPVQRSDALSYVAELESWMAALRCRLLHGMQRDFATKFNGGNAADEVMAAQRVSAWAAERHVRLAQESLRAPALLAALESGRLGVPHAHRIAQVLATLDDRDAAHVAAQVCADERLDHMSVGDVGRAAARAAAIADPEAAAQRRMTEKAKADVTMEPAPDAMAWLTAYGPAEDVAAAMTSICGHALDARRAGSEAPLGMLRFQAAIQLLIAASPGAADTDPDATERDATKRRAGGAHRPRGPRRVVVTQVTVPLVTLAGIQDAPGELAGYGPIPAPVARQLAAQSGVWWRLLTDPATGQLCPTPASEYRIPEAVRRFVQGRDRVCSHPGCDRPAQDCDLDHANAYPHGPTCPCNLTPRCRRHHNAKTHHRWRIRARLDGRHLTTSPTGRVYATAPDPPPGPVRDGRPWWWPDIWPPRAGEHGIDLIDQLADPALDLTPAEWAHIDRQLASVS